MIMSKAALRKELDKLTCKELESFTGFGWDNMDSFLEDYKKQRGKEQGSEVTKLSTSTKMVKPMPEVFPTLYPEIKPKFNEYKNVKCPKCKSIFILIHKTWDKYRSYNITFFYECERCGLSWNPGEEVDNGGVK